MSDDAKRYDFLGSQAPLPGNDQLQDDGRVWQPWAMGGGQWINSQVVRLSDADIERIADTVIRKLKTRRREAREAGLIER